MKQRKEPKSMISFEKDLGQSCPTCLSGIEPTVIIKPELADVVREV